MAPVNITLDYSIRIEPGRHFHNFSRVVDGPRARSLNARPAFRCRAFFESVAGLAAPGAVLQALNALQAFHTPVGAISSVIFTR